MNHSPAPWGTFAQAVFSDAGYLCSVTARGDTSDDYHKAWVDAQLIAAAPELLECLRSLFVAPDDQENIAAAGALLVRLDSV